jgi:prevent-host-death family protein
MSSYTIATAKEHLSRLIDEALAGEPVTITRDGQPVAELRASTPAAAA